MPAASITAGSGLPQRLAGIVDSLRRTLALRAAKDRVLAAMLLVLWNRLSRTLARFAAIAARHRAGMLRKPAKPRSPPAPAPVPTAATAPRSPPPRDTLPRQRGWLVRRVRECGVYGEHLRLLLQDPEMLALIEAAPQLRRLLRPLWRMLRRDAVPDILRSAQASGPPRRRPRRGTARPRRRRPPARAPSARSGEREIAGLSFRLPKNRV